MNDIILPPSTPRPVAPERKFKTKAYAKKLLDKVLGSNRGWEVVDGRYERRGTNAVPLRLFLANLMSEAKTMGLDLDYVVVRRGSQYNSISIEQRVFTESEEKYLTRYAEYEQAMEEHRRWDALPPDEKKRMLAEIKRQKKLADLQKKKDALKMELNKIADEIDRTASNA